MTDHERLSRLLGTEIESMTPVGGGDICDAWRARLVGGSSVFVKTRRDAPARFFDVEGEGLGWLRSAHDGVPVPEVRAVDEEFFVLEWLATTSPSARAAERFGRALANTHRSGSSHFGAEHDGWIGSLVLPNRRWTTWEDMWAEGRLTPFVDAAYSLGAISAADAGDVRAVIAHLGDLSGPPEDPALIHGDLWSGNVLWSTAEAAWLIDPAAHGGHRETDLAMLALFGAPFLDHILGAYQDVWPLARGWRQRVPLHQLHPVLVHAVLFGRSYGTKAGRLARTVLGKSPRPARRDPGLPG